MSNVLGSRTCALILSFVLAVLSAGAARAQDQQQPTIAKGTLQTSFAIVPEVKLSSINHRFASFAGLRGGLVLNRTILIGVGVYGVTNTSSVMSMGYGGLVTEYSFTPGRRVHLAIGGLVGAGALSFGGTFSVGEPWAGVVFQATRRWHLGLGLSYRFAGGAGPMNAMLSGPAITIGMGFGN
jgi:hypothetical protein